MDFYGLFANILCSFSNTHGSFRGYVGLFLRISFGDKHQKQPDKKTTALVRIYKALLRIGRALLRICGALLQICGFRLRMYRVLW